MLSRELCELHQIWREFTDVIVHVLQLNYWWCFVDCNPLICCLGHHLWPTVIPFFSQFSEFNHLQSFEKVFPKLSVLICGCIAVIQSLDLLMLHTLCEVFLNYFLEPRMLDLRDKGPFQIQLFLQLRKLHFLYRIDWDNEQRNN